MIRKNQYRNSRGAISLMVIAGLLLLMIVAAAFSFDYAKGLHVKEQLQNAADSAALAGAYEVAKSQITRRDINRARNYAYRIAERNYVDNQLLTRRRRRSKKRTQLTVSVSRRIPRSVTVTGTYVTDNMFASLIGCNSMPISASSTATVFRDVSDIKPSQLVPLAVSIDHKPKKGPQRNKALNSYLGRKKRRAFTIVLNPQNAKNAAWIKNWRGKKNPPVYIGKSRLHLTNGVKGNMVRQLRRGKTINVPLIRGGPPFNKPTQIVGVIGLKVLRVKFPNQIVCRIREPYFLKGTPGRPVRSLNRASYRFLQENTPWQVMLTK